MKRKILFTFFFLLVSSNQFLFAQGGTWTWVKGDSIPDSVGSFGTLGLPSTSNTPPALYESYNWTDQQGNFWLFGGMNGQGWVTAALWKYDVSMQMWIWENGPSTTQITGEYGVQGIPSPSNFPGSRAYGGFTWTDTSNNLWLFAGDGFDAFGDDGKLNDIWMYDISSNEWTWMGGSNSCSAPPHYNNFQSGSATNNPGARSESCVNWIDDSGNFWLFGGSSNTNLFGDVWKFDVDTYQWWWMNGNMNVIPQYGTTGQFNASNTPGSRNAYCKWQGKNNQFFFFGGGFGSTSYADIWQYDANINEWGWIAGSSIPSDTGSYGNLCELDLTYFPRSRLENKASWSDTCGNLWLYSGNTNYFVDNDLWFFDMMEKKWALISNPFGISNWYNLSHYGIPNVTSSANHPGQRDGAASWSDPYGSFWLFGGQGTNSNSQGFYNDLWKYVPHFNCHGCNKPFIAVSADVCEKFCTNFFDQSTNNPTSWLWQFPGGDPSSSIDQNPTNICYDIPGVYDVTLITTNANGSDTLTLHNYITVYPTPEIPTITQNDYTLTSSAADFYQWQLNTVDIPGATNQSYDVLQTGFYTVVVSDSNSCKNSSTLYVQITGIDEVNDAGISIYPNPSSGNLFVEFMNEELGDEVSIDVVNSLSQQIYSSSEIISSLNSKREINLTKYSPGVYFIEVRFSSYLLRKKIILLK